MNGGLPWWSSGWESTCQCRGLISWSRKISHAPEQLSLCVTNTESTCCNYRRPCALEPVLCNKRNHRSEKLTHHNKEQPPLTTTRESLSAATKTQNIQKTNKQTNKKKTAGKVYFPTRPKASIRKAIIKTRRKLMKERLEKQQRKINETRSWFFEKINKIGKLLARLTQK